MSQDKILGGLKILDKKLKASGKHLEIHMFGAMSLFLHGIAMKRETQDIVKLKVVAYYNRSANGEFKDYEDLKSIKPHKKLIEEGIVFLQETYSKHLPDKFKKEFLKEVELIKEDLEKI